MKLPTLMLDTQPTPALKFFGELVASPGTNVELDACNVSAIQPVGACLLAQAVHRMNLLGRQVHIHNWTAPLRSISEALGCRMTWHGDARDCDGFSASVTSQAALVSTQAKANEVGNTLAKRIAEFVPQEDRQALLLDQYGLRIHHAVQPALAYVLAELLDNVFSHSRTADYPAPRAWVTAQWYAQGDTMRLAVVDDGCGLLGSLRALPDPPRNHFEAATIAFKPFTSSKSEQLIYSERRHMGLGLTVCRDICQRLDGTIYAASGNARVINAGLPNQENRTEHFHQGTVISLEFHRRAATTRTLKDILAKYLGSPDLRPRFS